MKIFKNGQKSSQNKGFKGYKPLPVLVLNVLKNARHSEARISKRGTSFKNSDKGYQKKAAFTLVEVLIALLIIGVVAAMTLPTLFHNISERRNATKVAVFNSKFIAGLNLAKANGEMGTQYSSTEDFLRNGLSHNLKMITICGKDELEKCFGYGKIRYEDKENNGKTVDVSTLKTAKDLNIEAGGFEDTAAFVMADGTPVLLTYNKKCNDAGGAGETISLCVAGLFDINGSGSPNIFINKISTNGKRTDAEIGDVRSFNGAGIGCSGKIDNLCIAGSASKDYNSMITALQDINPNYTSASSWQTGKDYCEKVLHARMPSRQELKKIANILYNSDSRYNSMVNKDSIYPMLGMSPSVRDFFLYVNYCPMCLRTFWKDNSYEGEGGGPQYNYTLCIK